MPSVKPEENDKGAVLAEMQEVANFLMEQENPHSTVDDDKEDDLVAMCVECKNINPDDKIARSPFFQEGSPVPCCFCGGVTVIVHQRYINDQLKKRMDQMRGIDAGR